MAGAPQEAEEADDKAPEIEDDEESADQPMRVDSALPVLQHALQEQAHQAISGRRVSVHSSASLGVLSCVGSIRSQISFDRGVSAGVSGNDRPMVTRIQATGGASLLPPTPSLYVPPTPSLYWSEEGSELTNQNDDDIRIMANELDLLENDISNVFSADEDTTYSKLEKTLARLGFHVHDGKNSVTLHGPGAGTAKKRPVARKSFSSLGCDSVEQALIYELFPKDIYHYRLQAYHLGLPRVLQHVFVAQDELMKKSSSATSSTRGSGFFTRLEDRLRASCGPTGKRVQKTIGKITADKVFEGVFLLLTFYTLVAPEMVNIFGNAETDEIFLTVNTVVFFLFTIELVLILLGRDGYLTSISFGLDF
ncbi:unnamed protein product, partial [Polarella glacialis]